MISNLLQVGRKIVESAPAGSGGEAASEGGGLQTQRACETDRLTSKIDALKEDFNQARGIAFEFGGLILGQGFKV